MKIHWIILILAWPIFCAAEEPEIRAYLVDPADLKKAGYPPKGILPGREESWVFQGAGLAEPPFQSRFFGEGETLLDYTGWATGWGLFDEGKGQVVFNQATGRLVVQAEKSRHFLLKDYLKQFLIWQFRSEARVYRVPGVTLTRREMRVGEILKEGEELAGLSGLGMPGQAMKVGDPDGKMVMETECRGWFEDTSWDCLLSLESAIPGAEFSLKTGLVGAIGLPTLMELGSLDGESTLVVSINVSRVLADGRDLDEWVKSETGVNVVMEERVARLLHKNLEWVDLKNGKRYQTFEVPPTFMTFLRMAAQKEDEPATLRELFEENGVSFAKDDRLLMLAGGGILAVEASPETLELLEGITMAAGVTDPPPILGGSYLLLESERKLTLQELEEGKFRILRKICVAGLPGQLARATMGGERWSVESENQSSTDDDYVEVRTEIRRKRKVVLAVEREAEVGSPFILRQEKAKGRWRTWVGSYSASFIADTIKEGR